MIDVLLGYLMGWLERKGTTVTNGITDLKILDDGVTFRKADGRQVTLAADTIIPALPMVPDTALADALAGRVPEIYSIGDCNEPLLIADAIGAGMRTSREI